MLQRGIHQANYQTENSIPDETADRSHYPGIGHEQARALHFTGLNGWMHRHRRRHHQSGDNERADAEDKALQPAWIANIRLPQEREDDSPHRADDEVRDPANSDPAG